MSDKLYEVLRILDHRKDRNGKYFYKIRWADELCDGKLMEYSNPRFDSWEPYQCIKNCTQLLESFPGPHRRKIAPNKKMSETKDIAPSIPARRCREHYEADQKYGERLSDDALMTFCDRLKDAMSKQPTSRTFEGWLPINTILISNRIRAARDELIVAKKNNDTESLKQLESEIAASEQARKDIEKSITGKNRVVQILYDTERNHYVVVYRSPHRESIYLYDSLLDMEKPSDSVSNLEAQIVYTFGHLYEDQIPICIPKAYEQQKDHWSCGYRAIAVLLDIVLGRSTSRKKYCMKAIHRLLIDCLLKPTVPLEEFVNATISQSCDLPDELKGRPLPPEFWIPNKQEDRELDSEKQQWYARLCEEEEFDVVKDGGENEDNAKEERRKEIIQEMRKLMAELEQLK